jgi:Dolichyl-phosphate-mannose-protein mannosyltransferase
MVEDQQTQRLGRWDALITVCLAGFVAVLFFLFLERPHPSDPLVYFYAAWHIDEIEPAHRELRAGLVWPIQAVMSIFGYSQLSYYVVAAVAALVWVLSTWFFGRLLFGRWVGFLAGILIVYNPWVLSELTELRPDYLALGLFTSGLTLLLWCWRTGRLDEMPLRNSTVAILALAGVVFGWSYLAREFMVILFPLVPFLLFATRSRFVGLIPVASTAFACWLAELAWGMLKFGDPLARLHAVLFPRTERADIFIETDTSRILTKLPDILLSKPGGWAIVALLVGGVGLSVLGSLRGDRRWQLLALWLIGGWLFFTAMAMLPVLWLEQGSVYLRMEKFRYWALILPPMLVAGLAFAQSLMRQVVAIGRFKSAVLTLKLASGAVTFALLLDATIMVRPAADGGTLVRNGGNRDYTEFREFVSHLDEKYELVLLDIPRNPTVRAIPMFLNSWNGLECMWTGGVGRASPAKLHKLAWKDGEQLVVLDLTRSKGRLNRGHPVGLLHELDTKFENLFRSSSGHILVYRLG